MGAEAPAPEKIVSNIRPLKDGRGTVALVNRHTALTLPQGPGPLAPAPAQPVMTRPAPFSRNTTPPPAFSEPKESFRERHPCLLCFLVVLVIVVIVLGAIVLVFYLLYKPKAVSFEVIDVGLRESLYTEPGFNVTVGLTGIVFVKAQIDNPNRFDFTYNNVTGNLTFGKDQLAEGTVVEGRVRKQSKKSIDIDMKLNTRKGGATSVALSDAIAGREGQGKVFTEFKTTVTGTIKFLVLKRNYEAYIVCNITIVPFGTPQLERQCSPEVRII